MDHVVRNFCGSLSDLESALGMYVVGRHFGWRALYVVHSKKTIRRYEEILGIKVREAFEPEGPDAVRSLGLREAKLCSNFWRVISGAEKIDGATRGLVD
jgi:hypothetical protein